MKKEVGELRVQSINKDKEVAEVKTKEEYSWAIVAKEMKSHNVFVKLEKVESDMIVKKYVIRKEVKSTNEEETRNTIIMISNLKNKTGKSDVECVKDVFGKMGSGQSCDDIVDVVRLGSKQHSLQAVERSQRTQAAVQIVSNLPAPSNGGPIYRFWGMPALRTRWIAGAVAHKSG